MVLKSLLTATFREKIDTRFSHIDYYEYMPVQVFFMMTLEACNTSTNLDVEGAKEYLKLFP